MLRNVCVSIVVVFFLPLLVHAVWWQLQGHPSSWAEADWSSSGVLPAAPDVTGPVVHVLAGRTGRWKGIFAHHTWIVVKARGAPRYKRFEVVGWGTALRVDNYPADGRWYGNVPDVVLTLTGADAERAFAGIERASAAYKYAGAGSYLIWPGPNSNTFVAAVAREVPELAPALLPTAIGKDFAGWLLFAGLSPSRTGIQLSLSGIFGFTIGWVEGVEVNFLGLVAGVDVRRPCIKLPGWGRIGYSAA